MPRNWQSPPSGLSGLPCHLSQTNRSDLLAPRYQPIQPIPSAPLHRNFPPSLWGLSLCRHQSGPDQPLARFHLDDLRSDLRADALTWASIAKCERVRSCFFWEWR